MKKDLKEQSKEELIKLAESLIDLEKYKKYNQREFMWPKDKREAYVRHYEFFKAGKTFKERALIAANRSGKTYTACSEMAFHLDGCYPDWWEGYRFDHPIKAWSIGKKHETTRDILQKYLYGSIYEGGSGFIPKVNIIKPTTKSGIPGAILDLYVRHFTHGIEDGVSVVTFKSYDQGVEAFMGDQIDLAHMDEEPDKSGMYSEVLTRTMTTNGLIMCTFTPLEGMSDVVMSFMPNGKFPPGGIGAVIDE